MFQNRRERQEKLLGKDLVDDLEFTRQELVKLQLLNSPIFNLTTRSRSILGAIMKRLDFRMDDMQDYIEYRCLKCATLQPRIRAIDFLDHLPSCKDCLIKEMDTTG